jgi:Ca-activated chloride channel family protein
MNARVRLEHRLIAVDHDERLHVMLEIEAPKEQSTPDAPPVSLALVLDRSGSMSGRKLDVARSCALWLTERMAAKDRLGLVVFDHEVMVLVGPQTSSSERVRAALRMVGARGSTNLSGGWMKAFELLNEPAFSGPRRILLLTDGLANVGVTEPEELVAMTRSAAEQGVATTTIGFGEGFDESLLTRMADAGRGNAHFAASPEDAPEVFVEEAENLAALVAQNVSVEIRPAPSVSRVEVLGEYPCTTDGAAVQVELGDAYAGLGRRLVLALDVPGLPEMGPREIGHLVIRYTRVGDGIAQHRLEVPITVNVASPEEAAAAGIDPDVREEVAILAAAKAQLQAAEAADGGDFAAAHSLLGDAAERLRGLALDSPNPAVLLGHVADLEDSARLAVEGEWSPLSRKHLHYRSHRASRGRPRRHSPHGPERSADEGAV